MAPRMKANSPICPSSAPGMIAFSQVSPRKRRKAMLAAVLTSSTSKTSNRTVRRLSQR